MIVAGFNHIVPVARSPNRINALSIVQTIPTQIPLTVQGGSGANLIAGKNAAGTTVYTVSSTGVLGVANSVNQNTIAIGAIGALVGFSTNGSNIGFVTVGSIFFNIGNGTLTGSNAAVVGFSSSTSGSAYFGAGDVGISRATAGTLAIGTGAAASVAGSIRLTSITQAIATSGSPTLITFTGSAHTTLAASTESTTINFDVSATVQFSTGALTTQRAIRVQAPTYAFVGASTLTTAVTFDISGAPIAGTNATITNSYALRVGGLIRLVDAVNIEIDTTTGSKIATGTTQKLGFWNATPVVQPASTGTTTAGYTQNASANAVVAESTFTGNTGATAYTISDIVKNLKNAGLLAA